MLQSTPCTILMTADTVGGVWTYALELCKALQKHNIRVILATMGKPLSSHQWRMAGKITNIAVNESAYALEWMDNPWREVDEAGRWLLDLERQIQPDLIHLNNYAHGNLPWNAPVLVAGHSCILSWWQAVKGRQAPKKWNHYAKCVQEGLQHADYIVAVSHFMLKQLNKYYGPFSNSGVIYNARNDDDFFSSDNKPLVFSMGRLWDEAKNITALEEISSQISWPIYVAGEGRQAMLNHKNITFLGKIPATQISEWLCKTSIYAMPARYEPFGLSILEAALSGCALVLGNTPSLKEIWGDAALYASPDNPGELQSKIQFLIEHDSQRKWMAEKARRKALFFHPKRFARQYISVYRKLLQRQETSIAAGK